MMSNFSRTFRLVIGLPLFLAGSYFAFVSIHLLVNSEASLTRLLIAGGSGLGMATVGGFVMSDVIAERIAKGVALALMPFLNLLPGGRRKTDPQLPPTET